MNPIQPAHTCDCCGVHTLSRQVDPVNQREYFVCPRCRFVPGSAMTDLQTLIGRLWRQADQGGPVRPEDICAFQRQSHYDPYGTYEIRPPDPMEEQAELQQSQRLRPAIEQAMPQEPVAPTPSNPLGLSAGPEPALEPIDPEIKPLLDALDSQGSQSSEPSTLGPGFLNPAGLEPYPPMGQPYPGLPMNPWPAPEPPGPYPELPPMP